MKKQCRCCNALITEEPILHYEKMPRGAQCFPDETTVMNEKGVDLKLYQCQYCGMIQILDEPVEYYKDVIRAASVSPEMKAFRKQYFEGFVDRYHLAGKKIIEIGTGCGEFLEIMNTTGVEAWGLEHMETSIQTCKDKDLNVLQGFIENENTMIEGNPYDGFFIMNFLEHIPNPRAFLKGIYNNLREDAIGLVEVPNMNMVLDKLLFSEFISDHLLYFTKDSLRQLLEYNGFEVISCEAVWHDYVLAAEVKKRKTLSLAGFHMQMKKISEQLHSFIRRYKLLGKKVAVWGAGHQALALLALTGIDQEIEFVVDSATFKQGKYTPGTHVKIVAPKDLETNQVAAILVMAASYSDEVANIIHDTHPQIDVAIFRESGLEINTLS